MRSHGPIGIALTCLLTLPSLAAGKPPGGGGGPSTNVPVKTTIHDEGVGNDIFRIGSDLGGAYSTTSKVVSEIQNNGTRWVVDTNFKRPARTIWIDFTEPVPFELTGFVNQAPPFDAQKVGAMSVVYCLQYDKNLLAMFDGETTYCPLLLHFSHGGTNYRIVINSDSPHVSGVLREGDDAKVTCHATDSRGCISWRAESYKESTGADPNLKNVGMLLDSDTNTLLGYYYFSFILDGVR